MSEASETGYTRSGSTGRPGTLGVDLLAEVHRHGLYYVARALLAAHALVLAKQLHRPVNQGALVLAGGRALQAGTVCRRVQTIEQSGRRVHGACHLLEQLGNQETRPGESPPPDHTIAR